MNKLLQICIVCAIALAMPARAATIYLADNPAFDEAYATLQAGLMATGFYGANMPGCPPDNYCGIPHPNVWAMYYTAFYTTLDPHYGQIPGTTYSFEHSPSPQSQSFSFNVLAAAVPEPNTWALMLSLFALLASARFFWGERANAKRGMRHVCRWVRK